jgi:D-alanine-D-alanine ligase
VEGLKAAGRTVSTYDLKPDGGRGIIDLVTSRAIEECDVVFIALHGGEGEDGRVQAVLDLIGKPYTGSGVRASSICMEKAISKMIMERAGIPTPAWELIGIEADLKKAFGAVDGLGGFPVVAKPVDQGSTIGITIVDRREDLEGAIRLARQYSADVLLEKYIEGRELSVPFIEDEAYPVVEIKPKGGFYDYERKYTKGMTVYECPADVPEDIRSRIETDAVKAYRITGCEGFARVDIRLGVDGVPYFLEVNTIPGMTETSLVPMGAAARGLSFADLVDRIALYALKKTDSRSPKSGG